MRGEQGSAMSKKTAAPSPPGRGTLAGREKRSSVTGRNMKSDELNCST